MLETADRLVTEERQPAVQQFLLLVGGLRAMTGGERGANQVLDSTCCARSRWPVRAVVQHCARCGDEGPHRSFSPSAGGALCPDCRVPGSALPSAARSTCSVRCSPASGRSSRRRPAVAARGVRPRVGVPALAPRARAALAGVRRALRHLHEVGGGDVPVVAERRRRQADQPGARLGRDHRGPGEAVRRVEELHGQHRRVGDAVGGRKTPTAGSVAAWSSYAG